MGNLLCKNIAVAEHIEEVAVVAMAVEEFAASRIQGNYRVYDARKRAKVLRSRADAARLKKLRRIIFEQKIAVIFNQKILKAKVLAALTEYGAIPWDIDGCCLLIGLLAIMK